MAKAGYCVRCERNVWLREDGTCENGHSAFAISSVYDADQPVVLPVAPNRESHSWSPRTRLALVLGVIAALCLVVGMCVIVGNLAKPIASQGAAAASQWQSRVASDYPGWKQVGFNVNSFSGSGESRTTYAFGLVPPDRTFAVGVEYVSENGAPPVPKDETLRPAGKFHDRSESLIDYIESTYVKQRRSVTAVTSGEDGVVTVSWMKVTQVAFFTSRVSDFDRLTYDESSRSWQAVQSTRD